MKILSIILIFVSAAISAQISEDSLKKHNSVKVRPEIFPKAYGKSFVLEPEAADSLFKMYRMPVSKPADSSLYSALKLTDRKILTAKIPNVLEKETLKQKVSK